MSIETEIVNLTGATTALLNEVMLRKGELNGISTASINAQGHLILTMSDNSIVDAGLVRATNGTNGVGISTLSVNSAGHLIVTKTDSSTIDAGILPTASVPVFTSCSGVTVPSNVNVVRTEGFSSPGFGGALYYHNTKTAVPLVPGPNVIASPNNITASPWAGPNGATASFDGSYTILTDSGPEYQRWEALFDTASYYMTAEARFKKDQVPGSTRKAVFRLRFTTPVTAQFDILINTMEGTVHPGNKANSSTSAAFDYGIIDDGDDWRVWVTGTQPFGATQTQIRIYPANSVNNNSVSNAQGVISVRNVQLYSGVSDRFVPTINPSTSFVTADGRKFDLMTDQTITPFMFGCEGSGKSADDVAFAAFSNFVSTNVCQSVSWEGKIGITTDAYFGPTSGDIASLVIKGHLELFVLSPCTYALTLRNLTHCSWDTIEVNCAGGQDYETRSTYVGVRLKGGCGRMIGQKVIASNTLHSAFLAHSASGDNFNFAEIRIITGNCNGSGSATQGQSASLLTNWTWATNSDNSESFTQRSVVSVATMFPEFVEMGDCSNFPVQIRIDNYTYRISSTNRTTGQLNLYPKLPTYLAVAAISRGTVRLVSGIQTTLSGNAETLEGILPSIGDRVLLVGQTNAVENGVYVVAAGAWSRATDANDTTKLSAGNQWTVTDGASIGATFRSKTLAVTVGTTEIRFLNTAARYIWGAAFFAVGGNSLMRIGNVDSYSSGRCLMLAALHGCYIETMNASFCGQGVLVGRNTSGISIANVVERAYFEESTNPEEIVSFAPDSYFEVHEGHQTTPGRWYDLSAPRRNDNNFSIQSGSEGGFKNFAITYMGNRYEWRRRGLGLPNYGSDPITITSTSFRGGPQIVNANTLNVNLKSTDAAISYLMGHNGGILYRTGTGAGYAPTGNTTFTPPIGGTVNGSSTSVSLAGSAFLVTVTDASNLIWIVRTQ